MFSLNLLIGAGALQGLLLSMVLFRFAQTSVNPPLRWLSGFVGAYSLLVVSDVLLQTRAILELPHLYQLFDFLIFWLGPLCYGYVRVLLGYVRWRWPIRLLHFLPGLLLQGLIVPGLFISAAEKRALILSDLSLSPQKSPDVLILAACLIALAYLLRGLFLIRAYWRDLESYYSNTESYKFYWLVLLLSFCAVMWALWTFSVVSSSHWADLVAQLGLAAGVYALGYWGLQQPRLWSAVHNMYAAVTEQEIEGVKNSSAVPANSAEPLNMQAPAATAEFTPQLAASNATFKYAKTGIGADQLAEIGDKINRLMQTELTFLEADLSLADLAKRIGVSPHTLSQTFSIHIRQSFFEYINSLRVKEVQRCFAEPAFADQSILEIALASGFSSKATFNATFKRLTGTTPSSNRAALKHTINRMPINMNTK
jgi:AraC-like DNA-binding protein